MRIRQTLAGGIMLAAAFFPAAFAQDPPATVFEVDGDNTVFYVNDVTDYSRLATVPDRVPAIMPKNFNSFIGFSDIVAVNGKPVKGTWIVRSNGIFLRPDPAPGQAIADIVRNTIVDQVFEFLQSDGTSIGTIMSSGLGGLGPPPPGAPLSATASNFTVTGGTGAFVGVRGQVEFVQLPADAPGVSVVEDPSRRRANGGGSQKWVVHLIPLITPEVLNIWHSNFAPVTTGNPARPGEVVIALARGLGPTRPGVDPGSPFPSNVPQIVNSPIEMTIGGEPAEVVNQVGWPGERNLYRLDIRIPNVSGSRAMLEFTVAWIRGRAIDIPVR
jgi:uncharacterized protein (TIGR03437 family)